MIHRFTVILAFFVNCSSSIAQEFLKPINKRIDSAYSAIREVQVPSRPDYNLADSSCFRVLEMYTSGVPRVVTFVKDCKDYQCCLQGIPFVTDSTMKVYLYESGAVSGFTSKLRLFKYNGVAVNRGDSVTFYDNGSLKSISRHDSKKRKVIKVSNYKLRLGPQAAVFFHSNGNLAAGRLSKKTVFSDTRIPRNTQIELDRDQELAIAFFPSDSKLSHLTKGNVSLVAAGDVIYFHKQGRFARGTLYEPSRIGSIAVSKGALIELRDDASLYFVRTIDNIRISNFVFRAGDFYLRRDTLLRAILPYNVSIDNFHLSPGELELFADGKLKAGILKRDTVSRQVYAGNEYFLPIKGGTRIELNRNRKLLNCVFSHPFVLGASNYNAGDTLKGFFYQAVSLPLSADIEFNAMLNDIFSKAKSLYVHHLENNRGRDYFGDMKPTKFSHEGVHKESKRVRFHFNAWTEDMLSNVWPFDDCDVGVDVDFNLVWDDNEVRRGMLRLRAPLSRINADADSWFCGVQEAVLNTRLGGFSSRLELASAREIDLLAFLDKVGNQVLFDPIIREVHIKNDAMWIKLDSKVLIN